MLPGVSEPRSASPPAVLRGASEPTVTGRPEVVAANSHEDVRSGHGQVLRAVSSLSPGRLLWPFPGGCGSAWLHDLAASPRV